MDLNRAIYNKILPHVDHNVESVQYAGYQNVAIECVDCYEVVIDAEKPDERM